MKTQQKRFSTINIALFLLITIFGTITMAVFLRNRSVESNTYIVTPGKLLELPTGSVFLSQEKAPLLYFITDHDQPWECPKDIRKWSIFFFGYTECPAFCPEIVQQMDRIGRQIPPGMIDFYFVSIDPDHDSPLQLSQFLKQYHTPIIGLTGDIEEVRKLAQFFKVHVEMASQQTEHIEHAAVLAMMSPSGHACALFRDLKSPKQSAQDLYQILHSIKFSHDA